MKRSIVLILISLFTLSSFAETNPSQTNKSIKDFVGTYIGVAPSDSSPVGVGQHEMIIGAKNIDHRMATGSSIINEQYLNNLQLLSAEEVAGMLNPGYEGLNRVTGFSTDGGHPYLLFMSSLKEGEFALVLINSPSSMAGIMMPYQLYFNEAQIKSGRFTDFNNEAFGGQVPLLD